MAVAEKKFEIEAYAEESASATRAVVKDHWPIRTVSFAPVKRALDIIVSLTGLIVLSPILLAVMIAVKISSRGPILFRQTRVGVGGRLFTCYKFRSMCVDAEAKRERLLHLNEASGPVFKIKNDPRITPVGRVIRKFSLDELPQLYNVLINDMSLVGPRPPVPSEVASYDMRTRHRLSVKPGLTCLWQISGRSAVAFDRWVELDLLYIDTMSFWGDIAILLKTVPAVVFARGAH